MSSRKQLVKEIEILISQQNLGSIKAKDDVPSSQVDFDQSQSTLVKDSGSDGELNERFNVEHKSVQELEDAMSILCEALRVKYNNKRMRISSEGAVDSDGHSGGSVNDGANLENERSKMNEGDHQGNSTHPGGQEGQDNQQHSQENAGDEGDKDDPKKKSGGSIMSTVFSWVNLLKQVALLLDGPTAAKFDGLVNSLFEVVNRYTKEDVLTKEQTRALLDRIVDIVMEIRDIAETIMKEFKLQKENSLSKMEGLQSKLNQAYSDTTETLTAERKRHWKEISEFEVEVTEKRRKIKDLKEQLDAATEEIRMLKRSHRKHKDKPTK